MACHWYCKLFMVYAKFPTVFILPNRSHRSRLTPNHSINRNNCLRYSSLIYPKRARNLLSTSVTTLYSKKSREIDRCPFACSSSKKVPRPLNPPPRSCPHRPWKLRKSTSNMSHCEIRPIERFTARRRYRTDGDAVDIPTYRRDGEW